jgi:D-cysteine desulfhydrase family pyridoxal phosphate-dependent enzyme
VTSREAALDAVPRVPLANLPTRLEELPRLARHLGLRKLFVKRDDCTGLAMGGNKARKLEYDFAPILAGGHDVVVTVGGAQSNHATMTAAAARHLGLDVKLVLGGPAFPAPRGNMLLDAVYGAEVRYLLDDDDNDSLAAAMEAWVGELRREGRQPYALPVGGSTGLGALGYVRAMRELAAEAGPGPFQVVTAVGSCGTFAGLNLGARLFAPGARVAGISVSRTARQIAARTTELVAESAAILGIAAPPGSLECHDGFHERYGVATASGAEAIRVSARLEGLILDPVYTGKSMAGLFALARAGALDPGIPVVFLHTGGLPILFAVDLPEEHA